MCVFFLHSVCLFFVSEPQIYSPQTERHRDQIKSHTSGLVSAASYETAEENQVERNSLDQKSCSCYTSVEGRNRCLSVGTVEETKRNSFDKTLPGGSPEDRGPGIFMLHDFCCFSSSSLHLSRSLVRDSGRKPSSTKKSFGNNHWSGRLAVSELSQQKMCFRICKRN